MNSDLSDVSSSDGEYEEDMGYRKAAHENDDFGEEEEEDVVRNKPYDEEIAVNSDESVTTDDDNHVDSALESTPTHGLDASLDATPGGGMNTSGTMMGHDDDDETDDDEDDDVEDDEDDDDDASVSSVDQIVEYNPDEYNYLNVSKEIISLFSMIKSYKPHQIELDTKLKPFIPDYISSVGDVDPFIKVPRPDGKPDNLGLVVLDEPRAEQSDPAVIKMVMDQMLTHDHAPKVTVPSIQKKDSVFPKQIQKWIDNIENLHKKKPPQTVTFSNPMPEIETLMQYWSVEYEEALNTLELPTASLDVSTEDYAKILCALLDIPVHNVIESLHAMFSLYQMFRSNSHYNRLGN